MTLNGSCYSNCLGAGYGPPYCLSLCSTGTSGGTAAGSQTGTGASGLKNGVPGTSTGTPLQVLIGNSVFLSEMFDRVGNVMNSFDALMYKVRRLLP